MRLLAVIVLTAALGGLSEKAPAQTPLPDTADAAAPNKVTTEPKAVVELFTSQGCSSCPNADALLQRLASRDDVIALSLPVDYWDYLGWKDTLASPKFSERQRAYAQTRGDGAIYTPQVVVNGLVHVNGADEGSIKRTMEKTGKTVATAFVPIRLGEQRPSRRRDRSGAAGCLRTSSGRSRTSSPPSTSNRATASPANASWPMRSP